jgi:uncharacterized protein (DUF1697 family)
VTPWVALLRGVNVGGHRRVPMAALREALGRAGAADVRTHLQSGNVVLDAPGAAASDVEALVRAAVAELGVACDVVVRTGEQVAALVRRNPWPERVATDPALLNVGFLSDPGPGSAAHVGPDEEVRFDGAEVWLWYGSGQGRSKLTLDVGGRVLTVRNWRTVTALVELASR